MIHKLKLCKSTKSVDMESFSCFLSSLILHTLTAVCIQAIQDQTVKLTFDIFYENMLSWTHIHVGAEVVYEEILIQICVTWVNYHLQISKLPQLVISTVFLRWKDMLTVYIHICDRSNVTGILGKTLMMPCRCSMCNNQSAEQHISEHSETFWMQRHRATSQKINSILLWVPARCFLPGRSEQQPGLFSCPAQAQKATLQAPPHAYCHRPHHPP